MQESQLHRVIAARAAAQLAQTPAAAHIELGPGDDCAIVRISGHRQLLTVDHLIEGRHFASPWYSQPAHIPVPSSPFPALSPAGTSADLVARKAIARSVSDIAAMAATPTWSLVTAAFDSATSQADADALCEALFHWAGIFGCPLVGGDIAMFAPPNASHSHAAAAPVKKMPLVLTVTVGGVPHPARGPVLRGGALPGDLVCVTGKLGDSLASGRHLSFTPRVHAAKLLADALGPRLHAMIDLSDGLGRDAARLARASGVRLEIDPERLPLNLPADPDRRASATWRDLIADGEDYELLLTIDPAAIPDLVSLKTSLECGFTVIGRVVAAHGSAPACLALWQGAVLPLDDLGWEHQRPSAQPDRG